MEIVATPEMCYYCFDVLEHEFLNQKNSNGVKKRKAPVVPPNPDDYGIPDFEWYGLSGCTLTLGTSCIFPFCSIRNYFYSFSSSLSARCL